jgi:hypothetical protein
MSAVRPSSENKEERNALVDMVDEAKTEVGEDTVRNYFHRSDSGVPHRLRSDSPFGSADRTPPPVQAEYRIRIWMAKTFFPALWNFTATPL